MSLATACSGSDDEYLLSGQCVDDIFPKSHTVSAGGKCSAFSVQGGPCDRCAKNSTCEPGLFCAFDVCRASQCSSNADCGGGTCEELVSIAGSKTCTYGRYCKAGAVCKARTTCDGYLCCEYTCVNGQSKQGRCWQQ